MVSLSAEVESNGSFVELAVIYYRLLALFFHSFGKLSAFFIFRGEEYSI
jgi:hypothetical protein